VQFAEADQDKTVPFLWFQHLEEWRLPKDALPEVQIRFLLALHVLIRELSAR
jgi:hypothetical protein